MLGETLGRFLKGAFDALRDGFRQAKINHRNGVFLSRHSVSQAKPPESGDTASPFFAAAFCAFELSMIGTGECGKIAFDKITDSLKNSRLLEFLAYFSAVAMRTILSTTGEPFSPQAWENCFQRLVNEGFRQFPNLKGLNKEVWGFCLLIADMVKHPVWQFRDRVLAYWNRDLEAMRITQADLADLQSKGFDYRTFPASSLDLFALFTRISRFDSTEPVIPPALSLIAYDKIIADLPNRAGTHGATPLGGKSSQESARPKGHTIIQSENRSDKASPYTRVGLIETLREHGITAVSETYERPEPTSAEGFWEPAGFDELNYALFCGKSIHLRADKLPLLMGCHSKIKENGYSVKILLKPGATFDHLFLIRN